MGVNDMISVHKNDTKINSKFHRCFDKKELHIFVIISLTYNWNSIIA